MSHLIALAAIAFVLWLFFKRRQTAKAITKTGDREVWAKASDTRFPRYPRGFNPLRRKKGLK